MECKDVRERLSAYLGEGVSSEEKRRLEQHLESCPQCRGALEELKKAGALIRGLEEVEPPAWLTGKIMARVRAEGERKKGIFQTLFYPLHIKVPIEALAMVLIAVVAVYVFRAVEPEMKKAPLPGPIGPVVTREEAPKPYRESRVESGPVGGKAALPADQEKDTGRIGAPAPVQSSPASPATEPPSAALKGTASESRAEGAKAAGSLKKQDFAELKQAPRSAAKEEENIALSSRAKDAREEQKFAAAPTMKEREALKPKPLAVTIRAKDLLAAGEEVQRLLVELGAGKIERESQETKEVLTAELPGRKGKEFFEKLKAIGEIKEKGKPLHIPEGNIFVRVEIVAAP